MVQREHNRPVAVENHAGGWEGPHHWPQTGADPDSLTGSGHGGAIVGDTACRFGPLIRGGNRSDKAPGDAPTKVPVTDVFDGSDVPGVQAGWMLIDVSALVWPTRLSVAMIGPPVATVGKPPELTRRLVPNSSWYTE